MSQLLWGLPESKLFEAGVTRGVLYPKTGPGVSWNGLTGITESLEGGDPRPYYYDGYKYLSITSSSSFKATISGYSVPDEFYQCIGQCAIYPGLYITQQGRSEFGFSYITNIGNELDGLEYGYKIHLVYNCLVVPSEQNFNSLSESVEASEFSFDLITRPAPIAGVQPTSHFIIDSRNIPVSALTILENWLYGTPGTFAYLPEPNDIVDMINEVIDTISSGYGLDLYGVNLYGL